MVRSLYRTVLCGGLLALLALGGCQKQPAGAGNTIKVGEFESLTGKEATFGQSAHKATLLHVEEINAAGGVLGKKIELITEDDASKLGESATIARKLISRDQVCAVMGEIASGRSLEAAPICQQARIPMITPGSTNPTVTEKGDEIFRVCFTDKFQAAAIAKFVRSDLHLKRVAILKCQTAPYSMGLASYFRQRFTADGGAIALETEYSDGDKDFKAQLTSIKGAGVDGILVPGYYTEVGLICAQARELGITVPLFGGDGWEAPELVKIGGKAVDGCYYSTHYSPQNDTPEVKSFVQKFQERWGGETPDAMAALGYDAAGVLADAIKRAGSADPAAIRQALASTQNYVGVTGRMSIDAQRNTHKEAFIIHIENGRFNLLKTISPADIEASP